MLWTNRHWGRVCATRRFDTCVDDITEDDFILGGSSLSLPPSPPYAHLLTSPLIVPDASTSYLDLGRSWLGTCPDFLGSLRCVSSSWLS